ncbi:hypothetical protein QR98_0017830 [Sarcoptes scabiei]|uniref:Phosphorylated adapter RNA export protein n=1 Tax=Sarcoptes scabiei TaxID=52283 RepID=A0A131ZWX8_SARSC|nr:hypothetical protein QR98_0017830 [Sarcoptes scabiei]
MATIPNQHENNMSDDIFSPKKLSISNQIGNKNNQTDEIDLIANDFKPLIRPSKKLDIVERNPGSMTITNRFNIWSDMLMEDKLSSLMNKSLRIENGFKNSKRRFRKKKNWSSEKNDSKKPPKQDSFIGKKIHFQPSKLSNETFRIEFEIAKKLKESRIDLIARAIKILGEEKIRRLVSEVNDIESVGGLMTTNYQRRRSPGGVLFHLIKNDPNISVEQKESIFGDNNLRKDSKKKSNRLSCSFSNKKNKNIRKKKRIRKKK